MQTESREASIPSSLLTLAAQVTDCHSAIFDAATALLAAYRAFMKCFATRLLRASLARSRQVQSPCQEEEIDRCMHVPEMNTTRFAAQFHG